MSVSCPLWVVHVRRLASLATQHGELLVPINSPRNMTGARDFAIFSSFPFLFRENENAAGLARSDKSKFEHTAKNCKNATRPRQPQTKQPTATEARDLVPSPTLRPVPPTNQPTSSSSAAVHLCSCSVSTLSTRARPVARHTADLGTGLHCTPSDSINQTCGYTLNPTNKSTPTE